MSNVFIINGHQPYPSSPGKLNASLVERAHRYFETEGCDTRVTKVAQGYDPEREVSNHQWADVVIMQFPVNWMGVPWLFKKYIDQVYSAGSNGRLYNGDGRTTMSPKANYGTGGALAGTKYMLSVTFNAPREAFNDPEQPLFQGLSVDDLLLPMHLNARFFSMAKLPTFAAFDVKKDPEIDSDFARFDTHLRTVFPSCSKVAM